VVVFSSDKAWMCIYIKNCHFKLEQKWYISMFKTVDIFSLIVQKLQKINWLPTYQPGFFLVSLSYILFQLLQVHVHFRNIAPEFSLHAFINFTLYTCTQACYIQEGAQYLWYKLWCNIKQKLWYFNRWCKVKLWYFKL
jgi:hypothetical protein